MTFDDDMIKIGDTFIPCKNLGVEWPPPEQMLMPGGFLYKRVSYSQITDEQRAGMKHVFRGAEYECVGVYIACEMSVEIDVETVH